MNYQHLLRSSLMGVTLLAAPAAWAAGMDSQTFIKNAIQGNLAEISVGKLAQEKGSTEAVKNFGTTLVNDHTKANQDATDVAKGMNVAVPTAPNDEQMAMHNKLANETGTTFDHDFLAGMVDDHKKDISDYENASANDKDAAGQYAGKTLPTLKQHLATAEKLAGGSTDGGTMAATDDMGLKAGANSFTEGQAKSRIEKAGYTNVSGLKKDDQGIWRGTASKNGQSGPVGVDFRGNVASQ